MAWRGCRGGLPPLLRARPWQSAHASPLQCRSTRLRGLAPMQSSRPVASRPPSLAAGAAASEWSALASLGGYIWPKDNPEARRRVAVAAGLMLVSKGLNIQVPLVLRSVIDSLSPVADTVSLADAALGVPFVAIVSYGAVRVGVSACSELRNIAFSTVSAEANTSVSRHVFQHMHELSLQYHLSRETGALSTSIDRGKRGMQWILSVVVFNVVPTILEVGMVSGMLACTLGLQYAAITAGTIALYTGYTCAVASWRSEIRKAMNAADSAAGSAAVDSMLNYETVKIFSAEGAELERYGAKLSQYEAGLRKTATSLAVLNFGQQVIFAAGMTAMLAMCAQGVAAGSATVGDLVMANTYLLQLALPLNWLGTMYSESRRSLVDFQGMLALLQDKHVQPQPLPGAVELFAPASAMSPVSVSFDRVSFRYPAADPADTPLLNSISFDVPAGSTLGLVGQSGSGKSTLFRLLFRFYDPESGCIKIDGTDIRSIQLDSLRRSVGMIPQDVVLFNRTLYENVTFARPSASRQEVEAAIHGAALDSVAASLPQGLDTLVGERGLKLSGGEKQRVAIARTLLKRPALLLIDEGTSSLDSKTEADVLSQLKEVTSHQNCTTIMIAHRLSTLQTADEICVLREGAICEMGSHADLLQAKGEYAELWARQQNRGEH